MNGPMGWLRGWGYSIAKSRHQAPAADPVWGDTAMHDVAWDEIRDELGDDYATEAATCADDCDAMVHTGQMAALAPLPPDPAWPPAWQPQRATQTISFPPWETEEPDALERLAIGIEQAPAWVMETRGTLDLPGPEVAQLDRAPQGPPTPALAGIGETEYAGSNPAIRAGKPRRRRPWSGLFGAPNPIFPGQVGRASDTGHLAGDPGLAGQDGDGALTGEIVTPPAVSITYNVTVNVICEPSPALKAELARIDAEALAAIARIDALFADERDALHAWSGQLELTGATA